ncbi:hsp70-binding protein 1 isoform X2 [Balaenoptera acutorostrata]|uniref:Hsp70-binding protein 1 isoform X2 n=1 Tax=Balaenoptera acutorostrata TaxID=9767 RepID=A0ABM3SIE7_BALAC|nr:hsp70-binding protein 1 isoform X2 [Balaenoptera acutorostrata]
MANQGSGSSRLPLALPPASQGCSSGGSGSSAGGSGNPPPPRNLQGLLQMAITAGSEEPDPPPEPMSEERRQWLQEAMSAAFRGQREEVEQMKNCLRVLSQPTPASAGEAELAADQQEREGALELLADLCENMDNAADFCQLSGMHLLVGRYLETGPAGLRWRAAQLIGTCSQNVAAIQEQVLGLGALRKLLRLLDRDPCDAVRVKALFAISWYAIVWQLPFGTCLGQASPGATSPLLGRSPDCSCRPLHGGSQRFTLRPETRRRPAGGVCESCGGGGWGSPRGDASPGHWHLVGSGQGCCPHDTE